MTGTIGLKGRMALITGASRGIGAAVAKAYAAAGAHVILLARTTGGLEEVDDVIRSAGGQATLMPFDLMKMNDIDKLGPTIAERFGKLDIFVGNAGRLGPLGPLSHAKARDWDEVMMLNVNANFRLIRTLDPLLQASDAGRAIFVTSVMVQICEAYWGPYTASKAALEAMVKTYAAENAKTSLCVNLLSPGAVDTAMLAEAFPGGYQGDTVKPDGITDSFLELASSTCEMNGQLISL